MVNSSIIEAALARKHTQRQRPDFFMTQVKNGPSWTSNNLLIMDAVAVARSWTKPCITGYEIKVSRGDFIRDEKWPGYLKYCHLFYFVCPPGIIEAGELPPQVGLIYYNDDKGTLQTKKKAPVQAIQINSDFLMYIIMSKLESDRHPFYRNSRDYFEAWLMDKADNRELAQKVQSKLISDNSALEWEIAELQRTNKHLESRMKDNHDEISEIDRLLRTHGVVPGWGNRVRVIESLFEGNIPTNIIDAIDDMGRLQKTLQSWIAQEVDA